MKRIFTILIALMAMTFTQCKPAPDGGEDNTTRKVKVSCSISMNKNSRSDFSQLMTEGNIRWSDGRECVYLAVHGETPQIIELEAWADGDPLRLEFEGEAAEGLIVSGQEYDIWYFGHSQQLETPYINMTDEDSRLEGSISTQSGRLEDLGYCHIATTKVTAVTENDEVKLNLKGTLVNQIAIALLDLENVEELYGDAILGTEYALEYNGERYELNVTEDDNAKINVESATGISYVVLLPNANKETMIKHKKEDKTFAYTFHNYIKSNKIYYRTATDDKVALKWEEIEEEPEQPSVQYATVTTSDVTEITSNSAICGGNVTTDNGSEVTAKGICWSTFQNPTIEDNKTTEGSGTGSFTSQIPDLVPNTQYYVRAYATNAAGTSYGEELSFTTLEESNVSTQTFTVNGVSFTMIAVEGGTFKMGAQSSNSSGDNYDSDAYSRESPVHSVTLSSYSIGETEVTQELWEAVMGSNPSSFSGYPQRPVEKVSWNDCQEFITKLNNLTGKNFRLPTEAEWEYAARGGNKSQGYKYSGSNTIGDVAWYTTNSSSTYDVKTKQANELGIYDMSGNVYEWCQDWYNSSYYSSSPENNPTGPASGSSRVLRGGSWDFNAGSCRVSHRVSYFPDSRYDFNGLRLVL